VRPTIGAPWPIRALLAGLFCLLVSYAIGWHALPWARAHLPLAAPLVLFLAVALASIWWATVDVLRGHRPEVGRSAGVGQPRAD
jgi:hypothetical protein